MLMATRLLLLLLSYSLASGDCLFAADDSAKASVAPRQGYVQCARGKNQPPVPVYEHPCRPKPIAELQCGDTVEVLDRQGPWLKVKGPNGAEYYLGVVSVSMDRRKFLPVDFPLGSDPDCGRFRLQSPTPGTHPPKAVYQTNAEYSDEARRAKISGSVELSLVVGADGLPQDISVTKSLGHGLDEKAVSAVRQWVFEPAREDGIAVPRRIAISVDFHIYK